MRRNTHSSIRTLGSVEYPQARRTEKARDEHSVLTVTEAETLALNAWCHHPASRRCLFSRLWSVFRGLAVDVVDNEHGHGLLPKRQLQTELPINGLEEGETHLAAVGSRQAERKSPGQ
jgi:hypothetical protein